MRIKTASEHLIDLEQPHSVDIEIGDIAKGLSQVNRYGGQTYRPYSVAQHSVYVSYAYPDFMSKYRDWVLTPSAWGQVALAGLMHDASEAYIGDVMKPLKEAMPQYRRIEANLMEAIAQRFNINRDFLAAVHEVDVRVCVNEMNVLYRTGPYPHLQAKYPDGIPGLQIEPVTAVEAEQIFLQRFKQLIGDKREVAHA